MMHSDGDIAPIVPDLVEIGLTALTRSSRRSWTTSGCTRSSRASWPSTVVSTQTVLPYGTPDEVKAAARKS